MRKRIIAIGIAFAMICGVSSNVLATTYSENREIPISAYRDDNLDIDIVDREEIPRTWGTDNIMESSYVSPYVTSVKNQNPYGTCWAFSYIAASEASMIKDGLATADVDLSELHLAYYLYHSVTDPLGGTAGDGFKSTDTGVNAFLDTGGNQSLATYRVANWYGLIDETTAPYDSISESVEVVLADDLAYDKDVAHLENAYWVSMEDMDTVKRLIKEYGACAAAYYSADTYYNTTNYWYNNAEVAMYCPNDLGTNHGITIVGWDDNYSKNNFNSNYQPKNDGAWYCRNSWGTDWAKGGYFWISYEDVPLNSGEAFCYDYGKEDNYDKNYQYDGGATNAIYSCNYEANIYTVQENEHIQAVGFYTYDSNYDCTIRVYKNCEEGNPTSGTLLTTVKANQPYAGFHTVPLGDSYLLKEGETFSVVIYQNATDEEETEIIADSTYTYGWCSNTSVANTGQSFLSVKGLSWKDISSDGDNCRIKAYTNRIPVTEVSLDTTTATVFKGDNLSLNAAVVPEYASNRKVIWSSSDTDVATVDKAGNVTAVGVGEAIITCTSEEDDSIKAQCAVTVEQMVETVTLNSTSRELYAGDSIQLSATVLPSNATDKSIVWMSSDESVATVSEEGKVIAVGYGTAIISGIAADRNIHSATCKIQVYEKIVSISMESTKILYPGDSEELNVSITPDVSKTRGVYWTSSDENIVTVDANGKLTAMALGGPVTIRCLAKDGTGVVATCTIMVEEKMLIRDKGDVISDLDTGATYKVTQGGDNDATVQFVDGKQCSGKVTIPDVVEIDGVCYKITTIGEGAFKNNTKLTQVVLGDNITNVGKNAFSGCSKLTTVKMGNGVKVIGENSFYRCKKLKTVTLGKNVTTIGNKAFYQCNVLAKLVIPAKVSKIGKQAFYKCKKLKNLTIKTSKLTKKKIGSNAFKGIHAKATIKVPKKKLTTYKKILKTKGIGSKVKVKKDW